MAGRVRKSWSKCFLEEAWRLCITSCIWIHPQESTKGKAWWSRQCLWRTFVGWIVTIRTACGILDVLLAKGSCKRITVPWRVKSMDQMQAKGSMALKCCLLTPRGLWKWQCGRMPWKPWLCLWLLPISTWMSPSKRRIFWLAWWRRSSACVLNLVWTRQAQAHITMFLTSVHRWQRMV